MSLKERLETVVHNVQFREVQERVPVHVLVTVSFPHITTPKIQHKVSVTYLPKNYKTYMFRNE